MALTKASASCCSGQPIDPRFSIPRFGALAVLIADFFVHRPDKKGRVAILLVHMKRIKLAPNVSADDVAASWMPGFTGADLANRQ